MNSEARSSYVLCTLFTGSACYSLIFLVVIEVFTLGPYNFCPSYLFIKLLRMAPRLLNERNFPDQWHEVITLQTNVSPALMQSA